MRDKANPLSFEEHEELAGAIREFRHQLLFADISPRSRYPKNSKISHWCRRVSVGLDLLQSVLDNDFCHQFPDQEVYHASPYYGQGKTIAEEIAARRPTR